MNNLYRVDSNRESGHGRYDIQLRPYDKKMPGIIIELKVLKDGIAEACYESFIAQQGYTDSFRMQLEETISEANIQACIPYFNEGGQLCIIGAKYSIAGASFYYQVINLEDFVISEAFGEYMKAHTN
jgi:hypothetical protein